jgi:hypothetical protein
MMNRKSTPQLNRNELELISAYLDGQLPEEQVRKLRQRIDQDPAFKQAYEGLRLTRLALRRTPQLRRRRSFTLTPEMVGKPARVWNLLGASRLVAVVATVLLAVVFAGDMFLLSRSGSQMAYFAANNAAELLMQDEADMEAMNEPTGGGAEVPMAAEMVEEGEAVEEAAMTEAPAEEPAEAPPEPAVDTGDDDAAEEPADTAAEEPAVEEGLLAGTAVPTATPSPEGTKAPEESRAEATQTKPTDKVVVDEGDGEAEDDAVNEDVEVGAAEPAPEEAPQFVEVPETEPGFFGRIGAVRLVELALLALALVSGVVALVVGRRGR